MISKIVEKDKYYHTLVMILNGFISLTKKEIEYLSYMIEHVVNNNANFIYDKKIINEFNLESQTYYTYKHKLKLKGMIKGAQLNDFLYAVCLTYSLKGEISFNVKIKENG